MGKEMSLKERIKKAFPGMPDNHFDRHETDLYVKWSPELDAWLKANYKHYRSIEKFSSQVEPLGLWLDIPFAAWDEKYEKKMAKGGMTGNRTISKIHDAIEKGRPNTYSELIDIVNPLIPPSYGWNANNVYFMGAYQGMRLRIFDSKEKEHQLPSRTETYGIKENKELSSIFVDDNGKELNNKMQAGGEVITVLPSDLKAGFRMIEKAHPEYGVWVVLGKYDNGIWEIRGDSGDKNLFESELKFWRKANENEYAKGGIVESVKSFLMKKVTLECFTK